MVKREKNRKIQRKNLTIWFNGIFTEDGGNRSRRGYYFLYTCLYIVMVFCIFGTFFANGKSFIWASDGWKQTFQALQYYAKWLRDIVGTLVLEHKLEIPTFSFSLGYGSDIITTLHYFVIGAPFSFLAVFVPIRYMAYFYGALILLRLYLAGVSFSAYCFHMMGKTRDAATPGQSSRAGVLVGAFVYVFCGFALHASVRHPFFITPMVWFPLILTGAEKILEGKNPLFMRLFVCLSAASNFYFFYMTAVLTALYVAGRLVMIKPGRKNMELAVLPGRVTASSFLGTCMAVVLLLPVILCFLGGCQDRKPPCD